MQSLMVEAMTSYDLNLSIKVLTHIRWLLKTLLWLLNPISHEYGPLWPIQVKSVHHFHRFWTIDTKIHDFVSFDVCQVPVKPFLTFFQKYLKNLVLKNFGGPPAFGENLEKIYIFFQYIEKMFILLTEFGFYWFSAFFWGIYIYSYSNFQIFSNFWSIKCHFWSLWFQDS